ncbi:MAG: tetratricopeptide repeat protein [Ilumatobacteraceae bacterium]|jgi:predicted O-linked N-acetylglucosamine transferase (SPINDLY family)/glycosyltransferase involved in cell wall biosynthesis|nr:tetratricopeptide repeat protein [Ilumatobacteraceae bacterium]
MAITDTLIQAIEWQTQGNLDAAVAAFNEVLALDPNSPHALYSLGLIAMNAGELTNALQLCDRGINAAPTFTQLHYLRAAVLQAMGNKDAALVSYDAALQLEPDHVEVLLNSGAMLRTMFRHKEALERFNKILTANPNHEAALANCGIMLTEFKQSEPAIAMFERLIKINPDFDYAQGLLFYERLHICDWTDFEKHRTQIVDDVRAGKRACKSLAFMSASDNASDHLIAAKTFASAYCPKKAQSFWQGERYRHKKIRLAYVSPDFREHPVGHLMAGVFELHDKTRFETIAISIGIDDGSRLRARMLKAFDKFIDAREMTSEQIARMMRDMEIDIAVDLGGFTSDTRTDIFAYRPAPVQVNYLGYPGTMGTDYYDYILADRHVIPPEHQHFYTEKVAYLPDTYLPTDNSVNISERTPTRAECGLPETGFVFCSFSLDYKISPPVFDVWMRLLVQVPGSVLWLMSRGQTPQRNLRREAEIRGVDPLRLVFAGRVPLVEDHLARYRQADIFLDTHPYNAHSTASDALMAGLPVLTYMGSSFPSRVAGSLLHSIGIPELITYSLADYEAFALKLALDKNVLKSTKERILINSSVNQLFNTRLHYQNLEKVYLSFHQEKLQAESIFGEFSPFRQTNAPDIQEEIADSSVCDHYKIVIDCVFFQNYQTGIARVWRSLLKEWSDNDFSKHIVILSRENTAPIFNGFRYINVPLHNYDDMESDRIIIQQICDAERASLFISTYYSMPVSTPSLMMVHDMIPEVLGWDTANTPMWHEKHRAILNAHRFFAVSQNSANDLRRFFPSIAADRITVTHNGVDLHRSGKQIVNRFLKDIGIDRPYFLLVGGRSSYKNATLFFSAFEQFGERRKDFSILCTGPQEELEAEFRSRVGDAKVYLLNLSEDDLQSAYSGAIALIYPSLYEGFGMPVIEAMACHCPVIACPNSSIPEIAGDAAIFVGGQDVAGMLEALQQVRKPQVRRHLTKKGALQAKRFSWKKMAKDISTEIGSVVLALAHTTPTETPLVRNARNKVDVQDINFAVELLQSGKSILANDAAIKILETEPENAVALHMLGLLAYQKGDFSEAIRLIGTSLMFSDSVPEAYINLGCAYASVGNHEAAIDSFSSALRLSPELEIARRNLEILRST